MADSTAIGLGAVAGAGLPLLGAAIAAVATKRRGIAEQYRYERTPGYGVLNYIVPGMARYNEFKRLGYSRRYDNKDLDAQDAATEKAMIANRSNN